MTDFVICAAWIASTILWFGIGYYAGYDDKLNFLRGLRRLSQCPEDCEICAAEREANTEARK